MAPLRTGLSFWVPKLESEVVLLRYVEFDGVTASVGVDKVDGVVEMSAEVDERVDIDSEVERLGSFGIVAAIVDAIRSGDDVVALTSVSSFGRERASATRFAFPWT